ncbi:MAG TPA: cupin domain-containing protein [Clostridiaceae bacterium]|jgi:mannose-6-phosphate isomerase-like protein (cupin superfamily)|nr:cupin domain-containing protein [Clostridiaceae bacterium]
MPHHEKQDMGPEPYILNIKQKAKQNTNYRTTIWTGEYLQLTLMSIVTGGDIGLEMHPDLDQFIRVEEGQGLVQMGEKEDNLSIQKRIYSGYAFIIPAGTWHNLINTGMKPLKLYSIYAPPQHPPGTIHRTKEIAMQEEHHD